MNKKLKTTKQKLLHRIYESKERPERKKKPRNKKRKIEDQKLIRIIVTERKEAATKEFHFYLIFEELSSVSQFDVVTIIIILKKTCNRYH